VDEGTVARIASMVSPSFQIDNGFCSAGVADRPASLVVDVVRDSAMGFHFAYISIDPHEH
jgi:hypothetical protein